MGKFYLSTDTFKSAANLESNLAFIELFEFCYERKTRFSEITNYLSHKGWPERAGRKNPVLCRVRGHFPFEYSNQL